jgi:hypothetical protein
MRKTITYSGFAAVSLAVVAAFMTAKTYTQLGIAVLLYPLIVYFAYRLFIRRTRKVPVVTPVQPAVQPVETVKVEKVKAKKEGTGISDNDKRDFLKMIGAAGLSFFLFSIFNRRAEGLFFGKAAGSGITTLEDSTGKKINPAERQPTDNYLISEIDDNLIAFYGFTNKDGAWFILKEDPDEGSFRYIKGESNFSNNWTNRDNLNYDYYHNVFS